jgi:superfamily II RNA helicase
MTTEAGGFRLDPFQTEAIRSIEEGTSVIVAAPTGAGKTLIAEYAVRQALARGDRLIYTAPIKALSNQKFRDFRRAHGDRVGIVTGDVSLNPDAPILIMTTEIFRNEIFECPERIESVRWVVFDEVHYMDDDERGTVWEESIIFAPRSIRLLCLSATVPNLGELAAWIENVRGQPVNTVSESVRPVPLRHRLFVRSLGFVPFERLNAVAQKVRRRRRRRRNEGPNLDVLLKQIVREGRLPALYFAFQRRICEELAWEKRKMGLLSGRERNEVLRLFDELCETYEVNPRNPLAERMRTLVSSGVAFHHAGLLPTFKEIVEQLFTAGMIKLLFTTETFALGINMPAASVIFDSLDRFDGVKFVPLTTREYYQMAGRAGRRGMDEEGFVFGQVAPRFLKPTEISGTVFGRVEPVVSRFNLGYATLLNLSSRLGEAVFEVGDKSLAAYQERGKGRRKKKGPRGRFEGHIRRRIAVLRELGYMREMELLPRGRFAASAPGKEMQLTELLFSGLLEDLDPDLLNVALTAVVFEARGGDEYGDLGIPERRELEDRAGRIVRRVADAERHAGIDLPVKLPDFGLSLAAYRWSRGAAFEDLKSACSTDSGDLVRAFRMAIQLLRQIRGSSAVSPGLRENVAEAIRRFNRGEVDAERQLRRG